MRIIIVCLCMVLSIATMASDVPTVPGTIKFAGLNLKLTERARKKVQTEVNALTRNPKYFQIKVDRLQIYFPIIERIFREEGLPEEFKYLVLQESALISDAVSSSNAVGFWQFKKEAAAEVGLRVDRNVDERLNIVSSTRGAAKYLKKNNRIFFDNWVHSLLAYQQGPGGAQKLVKNKYKGSRSMPIDGQTHWYVIKFLAHKVAFEQVKSTEPQLYLVEYYEGQGKTLKEISDNKGMSFEQVQKYNKWLKRGKVPDDKPYAVMLPYQQKPHILVASTERPGIISKTSESSTNSTSRNYRTNPSRYPLIRQYRNPSKGAKFNGIRGIRLTKNMDLISLEKATGVNVKRLLYYNDIKGRKQPKAGELWYLKPKRSKAKEAYHVIEPGEDLWTVSQKYGIKLSQLRKKNHISKRQIRVKVGRVLWMQETRPLNTPVAYQLEDPSNNNSRSSANTASDSSGSTDSAATVKPKAETPKTTVVPEPSEDPKPNETFEPANNSGSKNLTKPIQKVHTVATGETLYSISKKYGVTVLQLQEWNKLDNSSVLSIGQSIQVYQEQQPTDEHKPALKSADNQFVLHKVKAGETLYQIARDYGATIKQLMEWNQKTDFKLKVGEELRILKSP